MALVAALASLQQCRQALSESGVLAALATACLVREAGLECKGKCMTAMSLVLEEVRQGREERSAQHGESQVLTDAAASALAVLRECEQEWSSQSKGAEMQVISTVTQTACMVIGSIAQRCSALCMSLDPSICQELQSWVETLQTLQTHERAPKTPLQLRLYDSQSAIQNGTGTTANVLVEAESDSPGAHTKGREVQGRAAKSRDAAAASAALARGRILQQLKACVADVFNADQYQQSMAAKVGVTTALVHGKMRGVPELMALVDKAHHLPHTQCGCEREGTTCGAARRAAALELQRWSKMPGGLEFLTRARAAGSIGPAIGGGVLPVVLKCLRLSRCHTSLPSDLWFVCAQLLTRLVSAEAAVPQFVREEGMALLLALCEHPQQLVKGSVLQMLLALAATGVGKALVIRAPLGDMLVWGLKTEAHQEISLCLLATWWEPGGGSQEERAMQHPDLAHVGHALRECMQRGSTQVLGSAAILLGKLLASESSTSPTPQLAGFVKDVCEAMEACRLSDEVAAVTRVLACASARHASKAVLFAVRHSICASVEYAAGVCGDERVVDHGQVLLRNMGTSDVDCMAFCARHLVRMLLCAQPCNSLCEMVRAMRMRAPCRSLRLLCHLISGHEAGRKAVMAEQGHQVLLAFLCSRQPAAGGEHHVGADLARRMVATALSTAISKRMLDDLDAPACGAGTAQAVATLPASAPRTMPTASAIEAPQRIERPESALGNSRGKESKAAVQGLVDLVQQFAGEHARGLMQPQHAKPAPSSARAPGAMRGLSDQDRALAAQALLQIGNDAVWMAAIASTKLADVICRIAEIHLEQCVLSERPHLYKHEKVLALALLLLRRVVTVASSSCPGLMRKLPLKRVLQGLVAASADVVKPAARSYLLALSASEAGSLRMLKDGVGNVLIELICKDEAFAAINSVPFASASLEYLSVLDNMCSTNTGQQVAEHLSLHPLLIQVLSKVVSKAADKVGCSMGASLLERIVACSSAAQRNCYTPCLLPLISVLGMSEMGPCIAALKTLKLLLEDTECLRIFVMHGGCGAVLRTCCSAVQAYHARALSDKDGGDEQLPPPLARNGTAQASTTPDLQTLHVLAAAIQESGECLMKASSHEHSRDQLVHQQAPARLAEVLELLSSVPWPPPHMCLPLARSLVILLTHAGAREMFLAPHVLHLSYLSHMLADGSAPEVLTAPIVADIRALLQGCAQDLSGIMVTLASVKPSTTTCLTRRQHVLQQLLPNTSASHVSSFMDKKGLDIDKDKDKEDRKMTRGKRRRGGGGKARAAGKQALRTIVFQRMESLLGTLTTLRVLSHLSPARQYVAKSEGEGILTGLAPHLLQVLRAALHLLQPLLGQMRPEALDCSAKAAFSADLKYSPLNRLAICVWTCLSAVANFAREEVYISRVLQDAHGTEVLCEAVACRHACVAAAAAVVIRQLSSSGHARHTLIGAGCVAALMARCSLAEPCLLRSAATEALQALTNGVEARCHLHSLKPLLTRETLLALGAACLTSTVQKLVDLLVSLSTCNLQEIMTLLQVESDALKLCLSSASPQPSEVSEQSACVCV